MYVPMPYGHPLESRRLRKLGRIAVWNRARVVIVMAMAIWVTDVSILIKGRFLQQIMV
jgi:hypothetical protein